MQFRLSPVKLQLFCSLVRSLQGLAPQEKVTVQEAVLMSLQNAEMDINHSGTFKLVKYWQKYWDHNRNFAAKWQFPVTEDGICFCICIFVLM
jgi:hypothetical protein